ncbi:phosphate regulon transcriptional regulatory protein phob (sphr) [hydrocarbon metagenome]|uniref:Phosphate regulon transcriptional regulatory protein phob (Sphr) n=1 Tax=hydrocarbon metagenome TaxID=938273 RepID=A0A0W8G054_9ZZZZ
MQKILIVEDEPSMRLGLKDNLEFEGYQVLIAEDGQAALDVIASDIFDLILLDVMLPKISGFDVCKKLRKEGNTTPIILLTAKGEEIDKVLGLELGADDYVTKPFSLRELLARIKAVLRRGEPSQKSSDANVKIGRLTVNFSSYNASEENNSVQMSHKEFEVLHYLWDKKNNTVSRDELLANVWGQDVYITTRTIDNFILKLRQKIEDDPNHPKIILTVHGIGYKLID